MMLGWGGTFQVTVNIAQPIAAEGPLLVVLDRLAI